MAGRQSSLWPCPPFTLGENIRWRWKWHNQSPFTSASVYNSTLVFRCAFPMPFNYCYWFSGTSAKKFNFAYGEMGEILESLPSSDLFPPCKSQGEQGLNSKLPHSHTEPVYVWIDVYSSYTRRDHPQSERLITAFKQSGFAAGLTLESHRWTSLV